MVPPLLEIVAHVMETSQEHASSFWYRSLMSRVVPSQTTCAPFVVVFVKEWQHYVCKHTLQYSTKTHGAFRKRSIVFVAVAPRLGQHFATAFRRHLASICFRSSVIMVTRTMCRQTSHSWHRYLVISMRHTKGLCCNNQHSLSLHRNGDVCSGHVLETWCHRLNLTATTLDCRRFVHMIFTPSMSDESYTTVCTQWLIVFMVSTPTNCAHEVT